jgi:hypothetical protein
MSLQHSPSSTSGCNDREDRLLNDDRDLAPFNRDKDFRSFPSLSAFKFGDYIPGAGIPSKYLSWWPKGRPDGSAKPID